MNAVPVLRAASGGLTGRLLQTLVIFTVAAAATAAATLALSVLGNANEAFTSSFAARHGADVAVTVNTSRVTTGQLAATRHVPGVTQIAGPYPQLTITIESSAPAGAKGGPTGPRAGTVRSQATVIGRASQQGPLSDLTVNQGHWLSGLGQLFMAPYLGSSGPVGTKVTVASAPGQPKLTIVGYGGDPGRLGAAWTTPREIAALTPPGTRPAAQMLYTFTRASTALQIAADVRALKAALPAGAVTGYDSWLGAETQTSGEQSVNTPFVVTFALIGLVLAVLIVASLVSGAVVASYRRIGVLKSIGFTPGQVATAYLAQIGMPTIAGVALGTLIGNLWASPTLNLSAGLFGASVQGVPLRINVVTPAGMIALVGLAALVPALRAGRLPAVQAITAGQAPRSGHGYTAHRLTGRLALPRPVTIGLATPFTRPSRSVTTLAVVLFGATAVILAAGLSTSVSRIYDTASIGQGQVDAGLAKGSGQQTLTPAQNRRILTAIRAQPGTLHYAAIADNGPVINSVRVPGDLPELNIVAYNGDSSSMGWPMISGHWFSTPREMDANTQFLTEMGLHVGGRLALTVRGRPVATRIVGQVYDPNGPSLYTSWETLGGTAAGLNASHYAIELRPGASPQSYAGTLAKTLGPGLDAHSTAAARTGADSSSSLLRLLTALIAALAGLGVLTSVLILARERLHDLGIFKALGMTSRQLLTMVICWVIAPAVVAAAIAIPVAIYLHILTVQAIGRITGSGVPPSALAVYRPEELILFAASGLAIAAIGALLPASRAAASTTTTVLHAE